MWRGICGLLCGELRIGLRGRGPCWGLPVAHALLPSKPRNGGGSDAREGALRTVAGRRVLGLLLGLLSRWRGHLDLGPRPRAPCDEELDSSPLPRRPPPFPSLALLRGARRRPRTRSHGARVSAAMEGPPSPDVRGTLEGSPSAPASSPEAASCRSGRVHAGGLESDGARGSLPDELLHFEALKSTSAFAGQLNRT